MSKQHKPTRKVTAATLGGAIATVIVAVLAIVGVDVPESAAAGLATILAALLGYLRVE